MGYINDVPIFVVLLVVARVMFVRSRFSSSRLRFFQHSLFPEYSRVLRSSATKPQTLFIDLLFSASSLRLLFLLFLFSSSSSSSSSSWTLPCCRCFAGKAISATTDSSPSFRSPPVPPPKRTVHRTMSTQKKSSSNNTNSANVFFPRVQ